MNELFQDALSANFNRLIVRGLRRTHHKEAHGFNLNFSDAKATMKADGSMDVSLYNANQKQVDSVAYFIDDVRFAASTDGKASITIADGKVGTRKILARVYSGEDRFVTQNPLLS